MRILFDHCVPQNLRKLVAGHEVTTAGEMNWGTLRNGTLLAAAAEQFDVMLTVDRNMHYQQNNKNLPVTVIVLLAPTNRLAHLTPLVPAILEALKTLPPHQFIELFALG